MPCSLLDKLVGKSLRLRWDMWIQLAKLADRHGSDETHEIRTAIREYLEKYKLWDKEYFLIKTRRIDFLWASVN